MSSQRPRSIKRVLEKRREYNGHAHRVKRSYFTLTKPAMLSVLQLERPRGEQFHTLCRNQIVLF